MIKPKFKSVEDEISAITGIKQKPGQDRQDYLYDQAKAVLEDISKDDYESASLTARRWAEGAGNAVNSGRRIPAIPDIWEEEEDEEALQASESRLPDQQNVEKEQDLEEAEEYEEDEEAEEEELDQEEEEDLEEEEDFEASEPADAEQNQEAGVTEPVAATSAETSEAKQERVQARKHMRTETTEKTTRRAPPPAATKKGKGKAAAASARRKEKAAAKAAPAANTKGNGKTMTAMVGDMLQRRGGATRVQILQATGWPSVSVQDVAKACGLKLTKSKERPFTYFGKP